MHLCEARLVSRIPDVPYLAVTVSVVERRTVTFGLSLDLRRETPWHAAYYDRLRLPTVEETDDQPDWRSEACTSEAVALTALHDYAITRDLCDDALLLFDDLHEAMRRAWDDYGALCARHACSRQTAEG